MPCPFTHTLRSDLPPLTDRIAALPIDERGYPIPFFVASINGKPDFRIADSAKWERCIKERLCWTCGQKLGRFYGFPIGPMCSITRTTLEPPSHKECAEWSVRGCPFLSKPKMHRREDEISKLGEQNVPGEMIKRNPGVIAVWTTLSYKIFSDGRGGRLIEVGNPETVSWWSEGRPATLNECLDSIKSGLPLLEA